MAISPPSDIVMDVARAVEPANLEAARAQLVKRTGNAAATAFASEIAAPRSDLSESTLEASRATRKADPLVKFEAMVLQSFVEAMLPEDAGSVYGTGMSGDMWKSMMAEQVAGVIAERGGIGIADTILRGHYYEGKERVALSGVTDAVGAEQRSRANSVSSALVNDFQRKLTSGLISDTAASERKR